MCFLTVLLLAVGYFFADRRWMNPDLPEDLAKLRSSWETLSASSIVFAGQCKWDKLVFVAREFHHEWEQQCQTASRKAPRRSSSLLDQGPSKRRDNNPLVEAVKLEKFPSSASIAEAVTDSRQPFALAEPAHAAAANEEPLRHSILYQDQHPSEHQDFWSPPHSACPLPVDRILPALTVLTPVTVQSGCEGATGPWRATSIHATSNIQNAATCSTSRHGQHYMYPAKLDTDENYMFAAEIPPCTGYWPSSDPEPVCEHSAIDDTSHTRTWCSGRFGILHDEPELLGRNMKYDVWGEHLHASGCSTPDTLCISSDLE